MAQLFNKSAILTLTAIISSLASYAKAEESSMLFDKPTFYIGAGSGLSNVDTGITATTGTAKLDEDDIAYKAFVGVNLNKFLSIEGFYVNLGEASLSGNNGDTFVSNGTTFTFTGTAEVVTDATAWGIAPIVGFDVTENFRPFAKVGLHMWDASASVTTTAGNAALTDSGTDMMFGAGFTYKFDKNIAIRTEFERFKFDDENVDLISASAQYTF
jgi:opacity protein-like surface antigen